MADFHVRFDEWASRNMVSVRVNLGPDPDSVRSVGTLVMGVEYWQRLCVALERALPAQISRGECQHGCGHPSHLTEACLAGVFDAAGRPGLCRCVDERPGPG